MSWFEDEEPPDIYRGFEKILALQHQTDKALEVAEQGRYKAFVHLLATRLAVEPKSLPRINCPTIDEIKQIARSHNSTLVYYSLLYDWEQWVKFSGFRLGFNQSYAYATELFIWVLSPRGRLTFRRLDLKTLWDQENTSLAGIVRSLRDGLTNASTDAISWQEPAALDENGAAPLYSKLKKQLRLLYQFLIEPVASELPSEQGARVIFIPQDFLFLVPFAALLDQSGKYLIEKYSIACAPAIQVLQPKSHHHQPAETALVVGNPTMPSLSLQFGEPPVVLSDLPGAAREAAAVAQLLNTTALIGDAATKTAVIDCLMDASIIHLATHGFLDDADSWRCAIALAPNPGNNGLLTIRDILNLPKPMAAQLAIISGCSTSPPYAPSPTKAEGGKRIWGDGVAAISRAFLWAGVPSIMMSLWLPPTVPTLDLMTEFYRRWQLEDDKAESLRQAMLQTMQQYPHPRDWAALTLFGAPQ
ncbi:MAG TPA: CHAT domain-containing protein [Oscillatoriaceae cyanobacterium M33_DOE_052]|uniref:CHAT domain-containing protein n=1 Tax=Planktothricoides sp. SpSt-374 TaxID=2282167 RepID=A0A7C3VUF7_9CYAN|nr:CHAT domain-containing protein [Oscillatoriaceae cyanobacterium M33_DOE_052]